MLSNEIIFIFVSFFTLILASIFLKTIFKRNEFISQLNRSNKIKVTSINNDVQNAHSYELNEISSFLKNVFLNLKNINVSNDEKDIEKLKVSLLELDSNFGEKIKIKEKEKQEFHLQINEALGKITEIEESIFVQNEKIKQEKLNLEKQKNQLLEKSSKELDQIEENIAQFKKNLSELVNLRDKYDKETIHKDKTNLQNEVSLIRKQMADNQIKFNSEISDKGKQEIQLRTILSELDSDDRLNKFKILNSENFALEEQVSQLKIVLENESKQNNEQNLNLQNEKKTLIQKINSTEIEIEKINGIIFEREKLQKEIPEILNKLKSEKQKFEEEIKSKDEIISKLNDEIKLKENEIQSSYEKEGKSLLQQQKELEDELEGIEQQKKKLIKAGTESRTNIEKEILNLKDLLKTKKSLLMNLNKDRLKTERIVKEKLSEQLSSIKNKYAVEINKLKETLKIHDEQIYTLKARTALREDRIIMEFSKRKQLQQEIIEKLKQNVNEYRENYSVQSNENNKNLKPLNEKYQFIRENFQYIENSINKEKELLEKITGESKVLQNEILVIEEKFKQETIDLQNLINLKEQYIQNLTNILTQENKFLKLQHSAIQEISKHKTGNFPVADQSFSVLSHK